jgi:TonB family protein
MASERVRRGSRRSFPGLLITIALHAGVLLAVAVAHNRPQAPLIQPRDFVRAEMVKLGKPRDKFWLPRIVQPQPSVAPPQTLKVAEDPNAAPAPVEAPRPEDPKISKDLKRALERARKLEALATAEPEEGALDGSRLGTSNQAVGDQYIAQVLGLIRQNYNLPAGMSPEQISTPPEVRVQIGPDGNLSGIKLVKTSSNPLVDDACISAVQLTRRVPPPPAGSKVRGLIAVCEK